MNTTKSVKKRVRNEIYSVIWKELKAKYEMRDIIEALESPPSLTTFWRAVALEHK